MNTEELQLTIITYQLSIQSKNILTLMNTKELQLTIITYQLSI